MAAADVWDVRPQCWCGLSWQPQPRASVAAHLPACVCAASAHPRHNHEELFPDCQAVVRLNYLAFMEDLVH